MEKMNGVTLPDGTVITTPEQARDAIADRTVPEPPTSAASMEDWLAYVLSAAAALQYVYLNNGTGALSPTELLELVKTNKCATDGFEAGVVMAARGAQKFGSRAKSVFE